MDTLHDKILSLPGELSPQFKKVADFLLDQGLKSCFLDVRSLASVAGVSAPTVLRFVRHLGYQSFQSFKKELRGSIESKLGSNALPKPSLDAARNSPFKKVFEQDLLLIESTLRFIRESDFQAAVKTISGAETVYLLGRKSSFALAYFLYYRLSKLGIDCKLMHSVGATVYSEMAAMDSKDVMIVVGFERISNDVCRAVEDAKRKRVKVIAVTALAVSPIAALADTVLRLHRGQREKIRSITAGMTLCHALVVAAAAYIGKRAIRVLDEVDALEERRGHS